VPIVSRSPLSNYKDPLIQLYGHVSSNVPLGSVKNWEIVADNLKKAGWSWGYVSAVDCEGRTIWIADAHRENGNRFVVRADENLTTFLELESAVRFRQNAQRTVESLK
jgi:hypothetical protein